MDLELEVEYIKKEISDNDNFAPFKQEVCLGIVGVDDTNRDAFADFFSEIGIVTMERHNENPTRPFLYYDVEEDYEYNSFFAFIDGKEIFNFSIPAHLNLRTTKENLKPVFENFWETNFEDIIKIRQYNRSIVDKLSIETSIYAANRLYEYYNHIEMDDDKEFFWLKKWASKSVVGKKALKNYYRSMGNSGNAAKLNYLINPICRKIKF